MTAPRIVNDALVMGESPRWHERRLWVADWGAGEVVAIDPATGAAEVVVADAPPLPFCFDFAPGRRAAARRRPRWAPAAPCAGRGRLRRPRRPHRTVRAAVERHRRRRAGQRVRQRDRLRRSPAGSSPPGSSRSSPPAARCARSPTASRSPTGWRSRADGATLVVAESYGHRLTAFTIGPDGGLADRRVWADLGDGVPGRHLRRRRGRGLVRRRPHRCCVRVREGGEVLDRVDLDRGGFACMLGGADGATLFVGHERVARPGRACGEERGTGQVLAVAAPAPHAGGRSAHASTADRSRRATRAGSASTSSSTIRPPATVNASDRVGPAARDHDGPRRAVDERRPGERRQPRRSAAPARATAVAPRTSRVLGVGRGRGRPAARRPGRARRAARRSRRRARRRGTRRRPRRWRGEDRRRRAASAPCTRRRARLASCRAAVGRAADDRRDLVERHARTGRAARTRAARPGASVSSTTSSASPTESASSASCSGSTPSSRVDDRLGHVRAQRLLAPRLARAQHVEADARDDRRQPAAEVLDARSCRRG